uniref:Uncharacterized protein n=1 Tax=Graphocephala atropunctata TaxID=36148 RepID=A0A1B6KJN2_9HEMI
MRKFQDCIRNRRMKFKEETSMEEELEDLKGSKDNNETRISIKSIGSFGSLDYEQLREWQEMSMREIPIDQNLEDIESIESIKSEKSEELISIEEECLTFNDIPDPGNLQTYGIGTDVKPKEESDVEIYLRLIKDVGIAPIKRIVNSLKGHYLGLEHYGLDPRQFKPLTEALMRNTTVQELNLRCNVLTEDALFHLGLLTCNIGCLRKLDLQHCKIGPEGVAMLVRDLEVCGLDELDLSHNEIGDRGMEELANKLSYNTSIHRLNLSHNGLTHQSAIWLADTIEENIALHHLDLSWNHISEEPGLKMFLMSAAESNANLLSLNLSWNSLGGDKIATIIKNFIGQHRAIQELDLSHNRLGSISENTRIAKGINTSETLKTLNLSYNGHTAESAFALVSNINKAKLKTLLLTNVWVKPEFEKIERYGGLKIVVEGVTGGAHIKGPDVKAMLLKRANFLGYKPKKKKKDFGWFLLRLRKADTLVPVKKAKFELLVQEDKIKFDEGMIDELANQFRNEEKKVDLNEMLEKYLDIFPDTVLPVPKEKKKKKVSKDEKKVSTDEKNVSKDEKKASIDEKKESKDEQNSRKSKKDSMIQEDRGSKGTVESRKESMNKEPTEKRRETRIDTQDRASKSVKTSVPKMPGSIMVKKISYPNEDRRKSPKEVTFVDENNKEIIFVYENDNKGNETEMEMDQTEELPHIAVEEETATDTIDKDKPAEEEIAENAEDELQVRWTLKTNRSVSFH